MMNVKFDDLFVAVCKETGGLEGLLQTIFGFMLRRTDFFYQADPGEKIGFPPGVNAKILMTCFQKAQQQHYKRYPKKSIQDFNKKLQIMRQKSKPSQQPTSKSSPPPLQPQKNTQQSESQSQPQQPSQKPQSLPPPTIQTQKKTVADPIVNDYNGGSTSKYSWSQQCKEVQATLQIDQSIQAKQLSVKFNDSTIKITHEGSTLLEGQFCYRISPSNSFWKVEKNKAKNLLVLSIEKAEQRIWQCFLKGDPEIDTTKVENSKKIDDFDPETQGAIRKVMHEQQRKQMGLPTTQQQKQHQMLRKAWQAQGSPFKGTPFDPSKIDLSGFKPQ